MKDSGWGIAACSAFILGLVVGLPYYGLPFFYDYFEQAFGWPRQYIVLGLPLGTLLTLFLGPLVVRRFAPRLAIVLGAPLCGVGLALMGLSGGRLTVYFAAWLIYMTGWILAGPLMHQILLTQCYPRRRGSAIAVAYFGISLFGALSVAMVARPLTSFVGFEGALMGIGLLAGLASPVGWALLPQTGIGGGDHRNSTPWRERAFWILLVGTTLSISAIGGLSQHLKLILREAGHKEQTQLDQLFGWVVLVSLVSGSAGRFGFAWAAERFDKRRIVGLACLLLLAGLPLLHWAQDERLAYCFALVFGLGMSADSLMAPLLAVDLFGPSRMGSAMSVIGPINTIGQTWFPFLLTLLWQLEESYTIPLWVVFLLVAAGRLSLQFLPGPTHEIRP